MSVRRATTKKMSIAVLGHPFGAGQVALPCAARAFRFARWVNMQHDAGNLDPIRARDLGIEQAKVGDEMTKIVVRQNVSIRRLVGDRWIGR
jgi:hypothetical protein